MRKKRLISLIIQFIKSINNPRQDYYCIDDYCIPECDMSCEEWFKLIKLSSHHGVTLLIYYLIKSEKNVNTIPGELIVYLEKQYYQNAACNITISCELKRILNTFRREGIEGLVLKGASMAENYYPSPELRPFEDIDILIHKKDMEKVKSILQKLGYRLPGMAEERFNNKYWYAQHFYEYDRKKILEIHWNIVQFRRYQVNIDRIWREAVPFYIDETPSLMMSAEDLIIYHSIHLAYHYYSRLIWFVDIALIINRNTVNWEKVVTRCREDGTCNAVYYALILIKDILMVDIPKTTLNSLKPDPLTEKCITFILDNRDLPGREILNNRLLLRYPLSFLLIDRVRSKIEFSIECLRRMPFMEDWLNFYTAIAEK